MIKKSILVVEDDELVRWALHVNLERAGFDVSVAESGESALALLEEQRPDLLLTDFLMPGIDGFVLMQQAKERYPEIKVIVFSGVADRSLPVKSLTLGADDFFLKPLNVGELLKRIKNILIPQMADLI